MEQRRQPKRYKADFNDVDDDSLVTTLAGWGGSIVVPVVTEMVELFDGDGNTVFGVVDRVENGLIYVRPDWSTWSDAVRTTLPSIADALFEQMVARQGGQVTGTREQVAA